MDLQKDPEDESQFIIKLQMLKGSWMGVVLGDGDNAVGSDVIMV